MTTRFRCTHCGEEMPPGEPSNAELLRDKCPHCDIVDPEVEQILRDEEPGA